MDIIQMIYDFFEITTLSNTTTIIDLLQYLFDVGIVVFILSLLFRGMFYLLKRI